MANMVNIASRREVYAAIDSERDYQDVGRGNAKRQNGMPVMAPGEMILCMEELLLQARAEWYGPFGGQLCLDHIRKVTAMGIQCMERYGAPRRDAERVIEGGETTRDPVHERSPGQWCFWDETWSNEFGPYPSEEYARRGMQAYHRSLSCEHEETPDDPHASDCATHNGPAYDPRPCDCGHEEATATNAEGKPVNLVLASSVADRLEEQVRGHYNQVEADAAACIRGLIGGLIVDAVRIGKLNTRIANLEREKADLANIAREANQRTL